MDWCRGRSRGPGGTLRWGVVGVVVLTLVGIAPRPVWGATAVASVQQSATVATSLVFDGVTVVDVAQGKLLPAQRVVIAGNRIQAVGDTGAVKMPNGAQVVDARGKYLIPGLWDLHTHSMENTDLFYPLFLANGVTGTRDAGSEVPLDTLMQRRREIVAGTRVGPPRQILSGPSIGGPLPGCVRAERDNTYGPPQTCAADSADAVHLVDSLKAAGADMIKPRAVDREMYFAIAAEARRVGIPFGGHIEMVTVVEALDSGILLLDHIVGSYLDDGKFDAFCWAADPSASTERCQLLAERLQHNGAWVVPTLVRTLKANGMSGTYTDSILEYSANRAREFWVDSLPSGNWLRGALPPVPDSLGAMYLMQRVGLPILVGTDVEPGVRRRIVPGLAIHVELAMYVAEGLTPLDALRAATLNPAKMLHGTDSLGTVATGKLADLVLLDADPLADITNTTTIRAVVANGRYFDRAALDGLLTEVRAKAKAKDQP